MINDKMTAAINKQINAELYSSYLYMAMAAHFEAENLRGFASWMQVQAQEEHGHAMKFFAYLQERGGRVKLEAIDCPPDSWKSPLDVFEEVYKHERNVTDSIHALVDLARELKDHATETFLQWFVTEQVEEEASADEVVQQLKMIQGNIGPMFMLDRALAGRGKG